MTQRAARPLEAAAAMRIAQEAEARHLLGEVRFALTEVEAHIAALEREYLAHCQTPEFRQQYREFAQAGGRNPWLITPEERQGGERPQTSIDMWKCHAWIAMRAHRDRWSVLNILAHVEHVFILCDLAEVDCPPLPAPCPTPADTPPPPPVRGRWWKDTSWIKVRRSKQT